MQVLEGMAAMLPKCAALASVEADVGIDGLHAHAGLPVPFQVALDLLGRPLLFHKQGEDPLAHV